MQYAELVMSAAILFLAISQYYFPRNKIEENSAFDKFQLSKKNILIKLKFFRYGPMFNYFTVIPYLYAWILFLSVFISYVLYWVGVLSVQVFLTSQALKLVLQVSALLLCGYYAGLQAMIRSSYRPDFRFPKEKTEEQGFMRSNFEYATKENIAEDNLQKGETKAETDNLS
ncbi:MAG: hypothetical protein IJA89_06025 [Clostridia bacterium]|nr:hypothetical protein [Clostridia bacterium]